LFLKGVEAKRWPNAVEFGTILTHFKIISAENCTNSNATGIFHAVRGEFKALSLFADRTNDCAYDTTVCCSIG